MFQNLRKRRRIIAKGIESNNQKYQTKTLLKLNVIVEIAYGREKWSARRLFILAIDLGRAVRQVHKHAHCNSIGLK